MWHGRIIASLAAMMLIASAFSFVLMPQSLRLDESQSLWETSRSPVGILATVAEDVHVPLYHELLHVWRATVGDSVTDARVLSLLFFLCAIPAVYMLGASAYGVRVGLLAALLLTLSPFLNWYANEIRMYTLFVFVAILNQYYFTQLFKRERGTMWLGYSITACIGVYVHYFFFLILFTEAVYFVANRRLFSPTAWKRFLGTWGLVVLLFLPWVVYVLYRGQAQNQQPSLPTPTSINLFSVFSQFLFGFQTDPVNTVFLSLWPVVIVLIFLALRKREETHPETGFFMLSVLLPIGLAFGISFLIPVFVSRYLIFVAPSLYILIVHLFARYPRAAARTAGAVLVFLMLFTASMEATSAAIPVKEEYRGVVEYLTTHASAQDVVIVSPPFTIYPIEYYYRGAAPLYTLPNWNRYVRGPIPAFSAAALPAQVADETSQAHYAWLILSYDQGYQQDIQDYFDKHYARVYAGTFSPGLMLYAYKIRYDTKAPILSPATTTPASPKR